MITVKLFATLRKGRGNSVSLTYKENMTIRNVIEELGLSEDEANLIMNKGKRKQLDDLIFDDAELSIFPALAGG